MHKIEDDNYTNQKAQKTLQIYKGQERPHCRLPNSVFMLQSISWSNLTGSIPELKNAKHLKICHRIKKNKIFDFKTL